MQNTGGGELIIILLVLVLMIFYIAVMWKVFTKAGKPGWASLIPFYNTYVMIVIAGKPGWWLVLFFIPLVNLIIQIIVSLGIAERFGKGAGFGLGLFFLGFIFYPILAFGESRYGPPAAV